MRALMQLDWLTKPQTYAVALALLAVALLSPPVLAAEFRADDGIVRVGSDETVEGDLFVAGQELRVEGVVNGDVFAAVNGLAIDGQVNGSVNAVGATVRINGSVANGVRAAATQVQVSGRIGRDLIAAGQSVELTPTGMVGGDAVLAASEVTAAGPVGGRLLGFAEILDLASEVGRYVDVEVGELRVGRAARVAGDLDYRSVNETAVPPGVVGGVVRYEAVSADSPTSVTGITATILDSIRWGLAWTAVQLLLGILLLALAGSWLDRAAGQLARRPWISLLSGAGTAAAAVPAILIVSTILITVFAIAFGAGVLAAIPVPFFGFGLLAFALYLSPIVVGLFVGRLATGQMQLGDGFLNRLLALAIGVVALAALGAIPFVGWAITAIAAMFGLGAVLLSGRRGAPDEPEAAAA